ncbi:MAG: hypothetical protein ACRCY8_06210 [Dermatophilaceae bacterium]
MKLPKPRIVISRTQRYDLRSGTPSARRVVTSRNRNPHHYVTHGPTFEYDDYGVHRGQFDRLSFFSTTSNEPVSVHMYDCRVDSDEVDRKLVVNVPTDGSQILEIPPGYAHWFTGLENVATRNDYSILAPSVANSGWNAMNDDIAMPVAEMEASRPRVRPNDTLLPTEAQFFISRMVSDAWRGGVSRGAARVRVDVQGADTELMVADRHDFGDEATVVSTGIDSALIQHGSYQQVRRESVTVASHVPSGVAQTLCAEASEGWPEYYSAHPYITMQLSTLTTPAKPVLVDLVDRCVDSASFGERSQVHLPADPRLCLRIAPGVLWRLHCPASFYYRLEYELHDQPAGQDLPAFLPVRVGEIAEHRFAQPGPRVSADVERLLAVDE